MIKKSTKDGFRNPQYDEWNKKLGMAMLLLLVICFLGLMGMLIVGE